MSLYVSRRLIVITTLLTGSFFGCAQKNQTETIHWTIKDPHTIEWEVSNDLNLPHADHIEMSGKRISSIIQYKVDAQKKLSITRQLIFPQLRTYIKTSDLGWQRYRAYLQEDFSEQFFPTISLEGKQLDPGPLNSATINGAICFTHTASKGIVLHRTLFPSMSERMFVEQWKILNVTDSVKKIQIGNTEFSKSIQGVKGTYEISVHADNLNEVLIEPHGHYTFAIYFSAYLNDEPKITKNAAATWKERQSFLDVIKTNLVVKSPDSILNTLFYFSKIRAAESIFESKMGLIHSPGGGRYYAGVWANDQAEYSAPFFPYLGYDDGNVASLNAYRIFKKNIPSAGTPISSSFEMEGDLTCCGDDRGDAAMIAYGCSQFVLTSGNPKIADELWPLIEWALSYCESKKNNQGVIQSDTDEMEGRIPTGDANLSTSSLYYGALLLASDLSIAMGKPKQVTQHYQAEAKALALAIDQYFGATIEGLKTYKYFDAHTYLRHWICLPLVMGIANRKEGTIEALFAKLWTDNGVRVEYNPNLKEPNLFWDRGTLYAFRGAFKAGASDRALEKLHSYSITRLLGFHVPYVVEAWPEGDMAHLSAESALYARIFTEGILGIVPKNFNSFECTPHLPSTWNKFSIENINAFGKIFSLFISRENGLLNLEVSENNKIIFHKKIKEGNSVLISLK